jgi:hypothetical protein
MPQTGLTHLSAGPMCLGSDLAVDLGSRSVTEVSSRVVDWILRSRGDLLLASFHQLPIIELRSGPHQRYQMSTD